MRDIFFMATAMTMVFGPSLAIASGYSAADAKKYIADSEAAWCASEVTGDPSVARRILADDYVGVFPDGSVSNKANAVSLFKPTGEVLTAHLDYVHVRFFGNTAVAQGQESDTTRRGAAFPSGRLIFTDVFVLRNGKWRIVNSEDQYQPAPK